MGCQELEGMHFEQGWMEEQSLHRGSLARVFLQARPDEVLLFGVFQRVDSFVDLKIKYKKGIKNKIYRQPRECIVVYR